MEHIDSYFNEMERLIQKASKEDIRKVIEILFKAWKNNNAVFIMGNGGSASTATHFVCDLSKCTIVEGQKRFKVMGLTDNVPLVSAWTNDNGFGSIFVEQLKPWLKENDVLIGISVHGGSGKADAGPWSQNLVEAIRLAKERRATVIGFSGFDGGVMKQMANVCVTVPTRSEPLGTPLVESLHVVLHHLICSTLKLKIENESG